ncbi:LuxR C-terminal-related transcriptional regulator [Streptomyces sp. NPDC059629]|uniref:helix-turn-helix transcriptional regulator n=1 Tax=Streptomyces sp. NPDC059629 TaxID=3346889 RepID=UPI00368636EF
METSEVVGSVQAHGDPRAAISAALHDDGAPESILAVALAELDTAAVSYLNRTGLRVLLLVSDAGSVDLAHVTSVRSTGILDAGAVSREAVHACLYQLARGQVPMPGRLAQRMLTPGWADSVRAPLPRLTPREAEALALLVDGLSNKQIARRLDISHHGAKRLVANILAKFNCPNRTQAVSRALREGLYDRHVDDAERGWTPSRHANPLSASAQSGEAVLAPGN